MKRIAVLLLAGFCQFALTDAALAGQSNTGCGLGSIIFAGEEGLMSQTLAATTNGIWGNQTIGITFGTSNCEKATSLSSNEKINKFVHDNMDNLATDISKGSGEYLATLAVLMDTPVEQREALYHTLQANFSKIYTSPDVTHLDVLNNIEKVLNQSS